MLLILTGPGDKRKRDKPDAGSGLKVYSAGRGAPCTVWGGTAGLVSVCEM